MKSFAVMFTMALLSLGVLCADAQMPQKSPFASRLDSMVSIPQNFHRGALPPALYRVEESVFRIVVYHAADQDPDGHIPKESGTGFVVADAQGRKFIISSFHIPVGGDPDATEIEKYAIFTIHDGWKSCRAKVIDYDPGSDLVKLSLPEVFAGKQPIPLSSQLLQPGTQGIWSGFGFSIFTGGDIGIIVFSKFLRYSEESDGTGLASPVAIFSDFAEHGFSGGPLVNERGEDIGIFFAVHIKTRQTYIVPSQTITAFLNR